MNGVVSLGCAVHAADLQQLLLLLQPRGVLSVPLEK
jgi:hypothetical protein